ncbi:SMI1/KNR4 family protein [Ponticaulis sp.]|uniref:SMI1/KNR4 family protein n=1 Tax=Ponticaulis sp. TaxID=2020902 RepID=UPI000C8E7C5E|nr:SMI1/KNR4 family protein [Ponticaulis sp.]MAI90292.1 hypothetical protein [Ponticaulis sp.]|tara:strand:- start:270749 stop:271207 length:459 start_codon:yes stop_codon:yes gene_type:complete
MSDEALIDAIRAKLRRLSQSPMHLQKALSDKLLADATARLAHEPPEFLVTLYRAIGNGGFGPNFGLLGLADGWTDEKNRDAVQCYEAFRDASNDTPFPDYLLPICIYGGGAYICADCRSPDAPLWLYDPAQEFDRLTPYGQQLKGWLSSWAG